MSWGSRDRVVWSRNGFVAYIVDKKVYVTWLKCLDGAEWAFVKPVEVPVSSAPVHLSWSRTSYDLAIVDEMGRVQITEITIGGTTANRVVASTTGDQRARANEQDAVVGTLWLGQEKGIIVPISTGLNLPEPGIEVPREAQRIGKPDWDTIKGLGPFHPVKGKGALAVVNGNGMIRLLVQLMDQQYREIEAVLEGAENVVHASIVPVGDALLVATYSANDNISVFKVVVNIDATAVASRSPTADFASLKVMPVASMRTNRPENTQVDSFQFVQPPDFNEKRGARTFVTKSLELHAVFSSQDESHIWTFHLDTHMDGLHPAFFQLYQANKNIPRPDVLRTYKLSLLSQKPPGPRIKRYSVRDTEIAILYSSGKLDGVSLIPVNMVFVQSRLDFSEDQKQKIAKGNNVVISPNLACVGILDEEVPTAKTETDIERDTETSNGAQNKTTEVLPIPSLCEISTFNSPLEPQKLLTLANVLATRYAFSGFNQTQCDDMLGLSWRLLHKVMPAAQMNQTLFFNMLTSESQRMLNVSLELPEDRHIDRVIMIPSPLQRWLSFQMVIGCRSNWRRTSGSRVAWTALNIQQIAFAATWTLKIISQPVRGQTPAQQLTELSANCYHIVNILGLVRWVTDLVARIVQEMYLASVAGPSGNPTLDAASFYLADKPNVFMAIILSKLLRYLFSYVLRGIRGLQQVAHTLVARERQLGLSSTVAHTTQARFNEILTSAPVPLAQFEKMLNDIDSQLKGIYNSGKVQERVKQALELELFKSGQIPKVLLPMISHLMKSQVLTGIDPVKLHFYDTSWIHIDDVKGLFSDEIDGIRKRVLSSDDGHRRCTRCGILSATDSQKLANRMQWTILFQRNCLCGGSWLNEAPPR